MSYFPACWKSHSSLTQSPSGCFEAISMIDILLGSLLLISPAPVGNLRALLGDLVVGARSRVMQAVSVLRIILSTRYLSSLSAEISLELCVIQNH
jgi:hypothetical protein